MHAPSHLVQAAGNGRVVIYDLELFVGYDPEVDEEKKFGQYDADFISSVVGKTRSHMERGQNPKLIVRHNDGDGDRPVVGDITALRQTEMREGVFGIVGDVEMSQDNFDSLIRSGRYPRRSAEIWKDGHLSEVALLGSETPARPLPDTKFQRTFFSRQDFEAAMASPGAGNTYIPSADDDEDKDMSEQMTALEKENAELRAQLDQLQKDTTESFSKVESERDQFQKQAEESTEAVAELRTQITRETFGRKLDQLTTQGYDFGDEERQSQVLDRIVASSDPEAELKFMRDMAPRKQFQMRIDQSNAVLDQGHGVPDDATLAKARDSAVRRCEMDDKLGDMQHFSRVYDEELNKLGVKAG